MTGYIDYLTNGHIPERASACRVVSVRDGRVPAEALTPGDRERLVREFHTAGWTDIEIATQTRMTTYTTGRIRERLELQPNRPRKKEAAA